MPRRKEGFKWDLTVPTPAKRTDQPPGTVEQPENRDQLVDDLEEQKQNCKPETVPSSVFDPPSDVKFVDFAKMMSPSGLPDSKQMEAIQKQMMEKYSDEAPPEE